MHAPDPDVPAVVIATVSHNSERVLSSFLESIPASTTLPYRVVVCDSGSAEPAAAAHLADARGARFVDAGGNVGYGAAMNRAFEAEGSGAEFLLAANPDIVLRPGALDELIRAARQQPDGGSFGPRIYQPDGSVYPSARAFPALGTGIGHALFSRLWPANPWTARYRTDTAHARSVTAADWLSGSCLLLRAEAFAAVGGFDARYFMYFEDVDLARRLGEAGWKSYFVPSAEVVHIGAHSTEREPAAMLRAHHESAYRFLAARYPGPWLAPLRLLLRGALAARAGWASRRRRDEPARSAPSR